MVSQIGGTIKTRETNGRNVLDWGGSNTTGKAEIVFLEALYPGIERGDILQHPPVEAVIQAIPDKPPGELINKYLRDEDGTVRLRVRDLNQGQLRNAYMALCSVINARQKDMNMALQVEANLRAPPHANWRRGKKVVSGHQHQIIKFNALKDYMADEALARTPPLPPMPHCDNPVEPLKDKPSDEDCELVRASGGVPWWATDEWNGEWGQEDDGSTPAQRSRWSKKGVPWGAEAEAAGDRNYLDIDIDPVFAAQQRRLNEKDDEEKEKHKKWLLGTGADDWEDEEEEEKEEGGGAAAASPHSGQGGSRRKRKYRTKRKRRVKSKKRRTRKSRTRKSRTRKSRTRK